MVELRQTQDQLQTTLKSFEKERGDLFQRLAAAQETLTAQEKEINSKDRRFEPKKKTNASLSHDHNNLEFQKPVNQ